MFSGIIEHIAKVVKVENGHFTIQNTFKSKLKIGQSVAHDGACMTIESSNAKTYTFFAMEESFKKTNFLHKKVGNYFNVERSLKIGNRVDGHFVSGHIDTAGVVKKVLTNKDLSKTIEITLFQEWRKFIVEKGSITINGVSLTVVSICKNYFSVCIIPHTQKVTNLGFLRKGDIVNLEFDMLGKYIFNLTKNVKL